MGAQAAALLATGVLGTPHRFCVVRRERLVAPAGWLLRAVALSHGGVGLAPWSYDGEALGTVLPDGTRARVLADLTVELSDDTDLAPLRRALDLGADLTELWAVAPQHHHRGWQLRATSPFEALVQSLAATNASYRTTQRMMTELAGDGPLPPPAAVAAMRLTSWGYRLPALRALCEVVDALDWDRLPDDDVRREVLQLKGFGAFAAASVLTLLGRPRPLVLDGWLASQVEDVRGYDRYGRWAGTVLWLDVSSRWL